LQQEGRDLLLQDQFATGAELLLTPHGQAFLLQSVLFSSGARGIEDPAADLTSYSVLGAMLASSSVLGARIAKIIVHVFFVLHLAPAKWGSIKTPVQLRRHFS
jgi:ABC-type uncharacterized transport system permease subunit